VCICAVVRDFQYYGSTNLAGLDASPDFESCTGSTSEKGIVANTLTMVNGIGKPVYAKTSELVVVPLLAANNFRRSQIIALNGQWTSLSG